jgi:ferredoxin-type protein NapH
MPETTRNRVRWTGLMRFRDIVRIFFIFSLLGLDVITEHFFGEEIEFESEFVVLLSMLLFGSFFCGWACPYGNISYYLQKLGRRILPRWQFRLPSRWDRPLRYLKYAMFAGFVAVFITQRISYFDDHFEMYQSTWFSRVYFITMVFSVLVLSLVSERFYCRYLCWQKAAYNLMNRLSLTSIVRNVTACVGCKKCDSVCPMDVNVSSREVIRGRDCISCYNCVDAGTCPPKVDAIELRFLGRRVDLRRYAYAVTAIYLLLTLLALIYLSRG